MDWWRRLLGVFASLCEDVPSPMGAAMAVD